MRVAGIEADAAREDFKMIALGPLFGLMDDPAGSVRGSGQGCLSFRHGRR